MSYNHTAGTDNPFRLYPIKTRFLPYGNSPGTIFASSSAS